VHMFVGIASLLVLIGYLLVRAPGRPVFERRHWLLLPAALGIVLLAELVVFPEALSDGGGWRFVLYFIWVLVAVKVLRSRTSRSGVGRWPALFAGVVAFVATSGVAVAVGLVALFGALGEMSGERRAEAWEGASEIVEHAVGSCWTVLAVLTVLLVGVCRRVFPLPSGPLATWWKPVALAVVTVLATGLNTGMLLVGNEIVREAMALPSWKPALVEMVPAAEAPNAEAAYYLDRLPTALSSGRVGLFHALATESDEDFSAQGLLARLAGRGACAEALAESIGPDGMQGDAPPTPPARCVSAVEARLYCEARGKRLPTPEEWTAALAEVAATPAAALDARGPHQRTMLAEWTMRVVHGTPTFELLGGDAAPDAPESLQPGSTSPHVGFRCAFRF